MADTIYSCPSCHATMTSGLAGLCLLICKQCHEVVFAHSSLPSRPPGIEVPPDWSFIQTGSTFDYNGESLTIVGRIRLQLRNDYKNLWCAVSRKGDHVWLMESFASLYVMEPVWQVFSGSSRHLHAGARITVTKEFPLKGEFVEKCEGISYEGQIGDWRLFRPGFYFTQAGNSNGDVCIFTIDGDRILFLSGEKTEVEKLNLKNILVWDEWK